MLKKLLSISGVSLLFVACGNGNTNETSENQEASDSSNQAEQVLQVASHLPPMTDVVEIAAENIEAPYSIELLEVSDNIQYNEAVLNDEAYANFAQHEPFMEIFNEERDGDLHAIQPIYNAIVGFYSPVYDSIDDIEDGAEVALPSDVVNEARALHILDDYDLIRLAEGAGTAATVEDIEENPYQFEFTSIDLLNLTSAYEDGVDLVFNYPTYISSIGLTTDDALFLEDQEDLTYALQVVVREENLDSEATQALQNAFTSQEVYDFLDELAQERHLVPAFEDPSQE